MTQPSLSHNADVIVVGAGLVGLTSALRLQQQGRRVLVMDNGEPGKGASFGNAGYLATELIAPLSTPETLRKAPKLLLDPHGPLARSARYLPQLLPWLLRFALAARKPNVAQSRSALTALNRQALAACQSDLDTTGYCDSGTFSGSSPSISPHSS